MTLTGPGTNLTEHRLTSWHVETFTRDHFTEFYDDGGPEVGPIPAGQTIHRPANVPDVVADEYLRVLDDFDGARCALGPDECVTEGGAAIGLHLRGSEDTYGNETEHEAFSEFVLVLVPQMHGTKAIAVCLDCSPNDLYAARSIATS